MTSALSRRAEPAPSEASGDRPPRVALRGFFRAAKRAAELSPAASEPRGALDRGMRIDPGYGARLRGDMFAAGLVDVHVDYITRCYPGGSLIAHLLSLTVERRRERLVLLGADSG